jgi:hypothetical protein
MIFEVSGYVVWGVEYDQTLTYRVQFLQHDDYNRVFDLSGRPDFMITHPTNKNGVKTTKASLLSDVLCIIEVQSKHRDKDIPMCEIQLQLYLVLAMNIGGLNSLIGFLVQDDGMCRTYRATRQPEALVYEQNDLVHVSHLPAVLTKLLAELP